jgi:hypothetical protein
VSRASASELRAIDYSAGNLGKNLLWSAADLTLLFILTDILGLPPGFAGTVMMLALVGDMVIDLSAGRLAAAAERYGIGYGHMLWLFAPACAASFALLYALVGAGNGDPAGIVLALVAFRIFYGLLDIPHNAMMPHVATGSRARGRVSGYRYIFSSIATLLVTLWRAPEVSAASLSGKSADLETFGIVAAGLSVLSLWVAASCFRAPVRTPEIPPGPVRILPMFSADYVKLLALGLLAGGASAMFARSMIYYGTHYLADAAAAACILSALVVGQLAGTILWSMASQRFDSRHVLASANAVSAILVPAFLLLPPRLAARWRVPDRGGSCRRLRLAVGDPVGCHRRGRCALRLPLRAPGCQPVRDGVEGRRRDRHRRDGLDARNLRLRRGGQPLARHRHGRPRPHRPSRDAGRPSGECHSLVADRQPCVARAEPRTTGKPALGQLVRRQEAGRRHLTAMESGAAFADQAGI